ncbi:IPT/TIG domain-containing protein [Actinoplanes couchii]|uniref:IPT/TIG domain-containing protein n=1 Tax=Actinoplanes couchii TaxID=403638 RepID=A0ABQ3X4T7_9ACTN|nr:IPT/TIG domain-containing protein [Actinoplanes couchii]MDR6326113.1 hypothetical protein [Actinoplanes couchii]GID53533.1 hypothetical protein Aco03nite_019370 [Actinoplanes couchii]
MPKIRKKSLVRALGTVTSSVAAAAGVVVAVGQPAQAAVVSATTAPIGGTVRITEPNGFTTATSAPAVLLRPSNETCAIYTTPSSTLVSAESATKVDNSTISFKVPVLPLGTNGVAKAQNVCVYPNAGNGATPIGGTTPVLTAYQSLTSNPSNGLSGVTNNLTLNSATPIFTGVTTPAALFTQNPCPAGYGVSAGNIPAPVIKAGLANSAATVAVPSAVIGSGSFNTCVYQGSTTNDPLLGASTYQVTLPQLSLSANSGPYDAVNNITANSGATSLFSGIAAPGVLFTPNAGCPANYDTTVAGSVAVPASGIRKLANNRLGITVPKLAITDKQPKVYQLCTYTGSSGESTVLGSAPYTSTVLPNPTSITPNAGPTTGGITITVNGTDFPTTPGSISATLGGVDLLNVTPVNPTSFTATLPLRTAGDNAALVVNTLAGSRTLPGAFSFRNALKILGTNTAPATSAATDVLVQGTDFLSQVFGTSADGAKIYLVRGEYDPTVDENNNKANGPLAECTNPFVLSDTELVCTLKLNRRLDKTGVLADVLGATKSLTSDIGTRLGSRLITSLGNKFSLDDIGRVLTGSGNGNTIPAGSTIQAVLTPGLALISQPATGTTTLQSLLSGIVGDVLKATTGGVGVLTTAGSNVVTASGTTFSKSDVGRVLKDVTGIVSGTTISAVLPGGTSAVLSAPATASTTGGTPIKITSTLLGSNLVSGDFSVGDAGAVFGQNSAGIPVGSRITQLTNNNTTAEISQAATSTFNNLVTGTPAAVDRPVGLTLLPNLAVPDGAYNLTLVSNGAPGASTTSADYKQTALTSGSIFTVSPF